MHGSGPAPTRAVLSGIRCRPVGGAVVSCQTFRQSFKQEQLTCRCRQALGFAPSGIGESLCSRKLFEESAIMAQEAHKRASKVMDAETEAKLAKIINTDLEQLREKAEGQADVAIEKFGLLPSVASTAQPQ